jgi:hypothetical protein
VGRRERLGVAARANTSEWVRNASVGLVNYLSCETTRRSAPGRGALARRRGSRRSVSREGELRTFANPSGEFTSARLFV